MKLFSILFAGLLGFAMTGGVQAQTANPREMARASVVSSKFDNKVIYVIGGNDRGLKYKTTPVDQSENTVAMADVRYFFIEPLEFRAAFDKYNNRQYAEALKGFKAVQDTYKYVRDIPNNYSTIAEFYAYECERRLMNIAALAQLDAAHMKKILPWDSVSTQLSINELWKLSEKKDWAALQTEAGKLQKRGTAKLTRAQLAQINYLQGCAYLGQNKLREALDAFGLAMLVDSTNSMEITREAILKSMEIYAADPAVKEFLKDNFTAGKKSLPQYVQEGAALMYMWKNILQISPNMPKQYERFLTFYKEPAKPEAAQPAEAPAPAAENKPAEAAPAPEKK